jgi:hypothetical protein
MTGLSGKAYASTSRFEGSGRRAVRADVGVGAAPKPTGKTQDDPMPDRGQKVQHSPPTADGSFPLPPAPPATTDRGDSLEHVRSLGRTPEGLNP